MPARQPRRLSAEGVHERGVSEQELVRPVAMTDPELLGLLRIPRHGGGGAVDLVLQAVLAAGAQLRHGELAACPVLEAQQHGRHVLRADVDRHGVRRAVGRERLDGPRGAVADRDERGEVGHHRLHALAGQERREVEPVGADVADGPEGAAALRFEPPVPVGVVEEPVLEVAPGDQPDVPHPAVAHEPRHVLVERVEPDVEVDRVDEAARRGQPDEVARLVRGHRQGLLAHDVPARREDRLDLRVVQLVGRRDVDDVDPVVVEQLVQRGVGAADVDLLRAGGGAVARGAEQAGDVDADPAQGLDVHRADEAAADHGGADVAAS